MQLIFGTPISIRLNHSINNCSKHTDATVDEQNTFSYMLFVFCFLLLFILFYLLHQFGTGWCSYTEVQGFCMPYLLREFVYSTLTVNSLPVNCKTYSMKHTYKIHSAM